MTGTAKQLKALILTLRKAQKQAAAIDMTLNNGGFVDSILGSMIDEFEVDLNELTQGVR